jgi:hypothetical protein
MKTVQEAYNQAFNDITSKGYKTLSYESFSEGNYTGTVILSKRATWKSPISIVFKVRKHGDKKLLVKQDKNVFMEIYGNRVKYD